EFPASSGRSSGTRASTAFLSPSSMPARGTPGSLRGYSPTCPPGTHVTCWDTRYTPGDIARLGEASSEGGRFSADRPTGRFGLLLLLDVLEHVDRDREFLADPVADSVEEGGTAVVTEGDGRRPLGVPLRRGGPPFLPPVVLLGHALAARAHDREGADAQDAPREHSHVPAPPHHERDGRGPELEDPMDPLHGPRLPQPRELQDCHLLPLRRPGPLPTLKPEEPIFCAKSK